MNNVPVFYHLEKLRKWLFEATDEFVIAVSTVHHVRQHQRRLLLVLLGDRRLAVMLVIMVGANSRVVKLMMPSAVPFPRQ